MPGCGRPRGKFENGLKMGFGERNSWGERDSAREHQLAIALPKLGFELAGGSTLYHSRQNQPDDGKGQFTMAAYPGDRFFDGCQPHDRIDAGKVNRSSQLFGRVYSPAASPAFQTGLESIKTAS